MTASVIDLRPSLSRTEPLHHQFSSKLDPCNPLNKTNEHCRSLFDLFPTSLRPRSHRQTSNKSDIDAVSTKEKEKKQKKDLSIASYCRCSLSSDTSFISH